MTDKIIFSTYGHDSIALQAPGVDKEWDGSEAEFEVTLPMDGVSIRGNRTVGYIVRAKAYFENGSWHFSLETPPGVSIHKIDAKQEAVSG